MYTGAAYGVAVDSHLAEAIIVPYANSTHLAPNSYANNSVTWNLDFALPIMGGTVPMSAYQYNITFWSDAMVEMTRTNDTHTYELTAGLLEEIWVEENEYWYDWASISADTIAGSNNSYETIVPPMFTDTTVPESIVMNITNDVINAAGAVDAYSKASAISDFLINGNATFDFKRNYNGSGTGPNDDITFEMLARAKEGTCSEFTTTFVTMARIAGLPTRFVTGYSGGAWTGSGYAVMGQHLSQWGEVRMELSASAGGDDLGWVPFSACPAAEELEIVNMTWTPTEFDRDGTVEVSVSGQFRYAENGTPADGIVLRGYVVDPADVGEVPGLAAIIGNQFGVVNTDLNGNFSMNGTLTSPIEAGFASIVIEHIQSGYVSHGGIDLGVFMNVTDDSNLTHASPGAVNQPVVGAGATTVLTGYLLHENNATLGADELGNDIEVWLDFTSSVDGATNLTGTVGPSGLWAINLTLSELETKANISATLGFSGWQDASQSVGSPSFHLRPSSHSIALDIRDAPNLTATIEGPRINNSILELDELVYVNGSAMSFGASPAAMSGNLSFGIREANGGGTFLELFNTSVNGSFSLIHLVDVNTTWVHAGAVELSLVFYPDTLEATDSLNTSGTAWWLKGIMYLELQASSQLRGQTVNILVQLTDHMGVNLDMNTTGDFEFTFNGTLENTTTDPTSVTLSPTFTTDPNMHAGDYVFDMDFTGNEYYVPSSNNSSLRIMGSVDLSLAIIDDWTHIGNQTWLVGDVTDAIYNTAVLNNDSIITAVVLTLNGPVDLGTTLINNSTGTFNMTITAPRTLPSGVYDVEIWSDFDSLSPIGGAYWQWVDSAVPPAMPQLPSTTWGIESEVALRADESVGGVDKIVVMNTSVDLKTHVRDIADNSNLSGVLVDYILDWGGANITIGQATTDVEGNATLPWTATGIAPGDYVLRMEVQDDVTSAKIAGATRHVGNSTFINVTVQVPSHIRVDSIPTQITAGVNFQVVGAVEDGDNASRPLSTPVKLEMFWLDNQDEKLINGVFTQTNGSFNMSVPTDVLNNGTVRGPRTLIITVVEGSSPFYLTDSSNHSIQVMGVSNFESLIPINPIIVNRGNSVNLSAELVESSNMWQALPGYTVAVKFDETWLTENTTDVNGRTNFTHTIPFDQPLGLILIQFHYNGSSDLLPSYRNISTVTVRSATVLVVDAISENPVAGESFNVTGSMQYRNGGLLPANILFTINGLPTGFQVQNGTVQTDGTWVAVLTLSSTFTAGSNTLQASFIPTVNYYETSNANSTFDSRGFTVLTFLAPALDGAGQPSLNDRTDRGSDVESRLMLIDNSGSPVVGVQVTVVINGTSVTSTGTTDSMGIAFVNLTTPVDLTPGFHSLDAEFLGTSGTTGLVGDSTEVSFVVLADTVVTITNNTMVLTAGDALEVNGTLLDDLGNPLQLSGANSGGVLHLYVDGLPVSSVLSDADTGFWEITWTTPEGITAGDHQIQIRFTGGRDWVDPIGSGDTANPEFYHESIALSNFSVSVPTKILMLTPGGQVDREDTITVQGRLLDIIDNPLENQTIVILLDGVFLTNVTTDETGIFTAVHPVPADAPLGAVTIDAIFNGTTYYLPTQESGVWYIYSQILVQVNIETPLAVTDSTVIDGFVGDNQLLGIEGMNVLIAIEGIEIGNTTTDANGNFSINWTVPDIFADGQHVVLASVPAQGWYRAGEGNTTFFLAHRSGLTVDIVDIDATRLDNWEIAGRLYDLDTAENDGLGGEVIFIYLDGYQVGSAFTSITGDWSTDIFATENLSRGAHELSFTFEGSSGHLPVNQTRNVNVWADVTVHIDSISSQVIRSDSMHSPLVITGRVTEIGGQGIMIDDAELILGNQSDCETADGARCIVINSISWNGGQFTLTAVMPSWLEPGMTQLNLQTPENDSLFLRTSDTWTSTFALMIDATFDVSIEPIIEDEQEVISGSITVTADDTLQGVDGIPITIYVENNGTRLDEMTIVTDSSGTALFEFNAEPPYGDASHYGEIDLKMTVSNPDGVLSQSSVSLFNNNYGSGVSPDYTYTDDAGAPPWWAYALVILLLGAVTAFVIYQRRKAEASKSIADIFSYTAELLAAGDSMREAIFNCYESLVHLLMTRGFLRRDFETVREFEMAIRSALPNISEESLIALDAVFEEARYSRHEMGESHKINAQEALTRVAAEINQIEIPNR